MPHQDQPAAQGPRGAGKVVAAPYRSTDQIEELLKRVAGQSAAADELSSRRALRVLDDLAEEMIGRQLPRDIAIKAQIQVHCERLRIVVS